MRATGFRGVCKQVGLGSQRSKLRGTPAAVCRSKRAAPPPGGRPGALSGRDEEGREAGCSSAAHRRQPRPEPALRVLPAPASRTPPTHLACTAGRAGSGRLRAAPTCGPGRDPGCGAGNPGIPGRVGGGGPGPGPGVGSRSEAFSLFRCLKLAPAERCGHVTGVANQRRPCLCVRPGRRRRAGLAGPAWLLRRAGRRREGQVRQPYRAVEADGAAGEAAQPGG